MNYVPVVIGKDEKRKATKIWISICTCVIKVLIVPQNILKCVLIECIMSLSFFFYFVESTFEGVNALLIRATIIGFKMSRQKIWALKVRYGWGIHGSLTYQLF